MPERKKFRMSDEDHDTLMAACTSTPAIMLHIGGGPPTPQENANAAWAALGEKMGFQHMTVRPNGNDTHNFTAVPTNA